MANGDVRTAADAGQPVAGGLTAATAARAQVVGGNLSGRITDDERRRPAGRDRHDHQQGQRRAADRRHERRGHLPRRRRCSRRPTQSRPSCPGFGTATREIVLTIGANATLDFKLGVAALEESITVTAQTPIVEVARAAPSSTIVEIADPGAAGARAQLPGARPADAGRRAQLHQQVLAREVRRPGRPAQRLHDDRRRRRPRRRHLGRPDREHQPGRGAGVQGVPQPVRRAVRRGAGGGGHRRHQVGHQRPARHRLLLRPRRRAERAQRLPAHQAGLRPAAHRRLGRRPDPPEPHALLRRLRIHQRGQGRTSSRCRRSNPFAAQENGAFPATSREHLLVARSITGSTTAARSSSATPSTTSTPRAPATVSADSANVNDASKMHSAHRRAELGAVELRGQHPARALHVERGGHRAGHARRSRRWAAVGDDRPELDLAAVLPAHAACRSSRPSTRRPAATT